MSTTYTFQRGETVILALDVEQGNITDVAQITGTLRQQLAPNTQANFQVVQRTGGWTLTIDPSVTGDLPEGYYLASAKMIVAGQTVITDPVQVHLT